MEVGGGLAGSSRSEKQRKTEQRVANMTPTQSKLKKEERMGKWRWAVDQFDRYT